MNPSGTGLFFGNPAQLGIQALSVAATALYTAVATFVLDLSTSMITGGLRVDGENERVGLDGAVHGERAFEID